MTFDLLLTNGEIVFPGEGVRPGSVAVQDGRIAAILAPGVAAQAREVVDCGGQWIMPGVIDPHTHIGFGDKENDFRTESRSAALGGVTTLITFHRSNDLRQSTGPWIAAGEADSLIDFTLHFGLTSQLHVDTLKEVAASYGVPSIKMYLMYKGAAGAAKGFTEIDDGLLYRTLREAAGIPGAVVGAHCENVEVIPAFRPALKAAGRQDLAAWDEQSPGFLEAENVFRVGYFGEQAGARVNIVHLSSQEGMEIARWLKARRPAEFNVETCAHYLALTRDLDGIAGKVNPPLRGQADVEALWQGIRDGVVTTVGSDHVPRKVATKGEDLWSASAGFPGIATLLPVMIEEGWHKRGIAIETLAAVLSANAADLYGLTSKGRIAVGLDADLIVVDRETPREVRADELASYSDYTPYEGRVLRGWPVATYLRGRPIAAGGRLIPEADAAPSGRFVARR
ncbi:MAG: dihydroorotase [Chelatococcus sp.]|nr:MAG: dihydroorotase [Chelatococcus sp.]